MTQGWDDEIAAFWESIADEEWQRLMDETMRQVLRFDVKASQAYLTAATGITRATLERAMEQVKNQPYTVCYNGPHIVSPHDDPTKARRCWNCGSTIPPLLEDQ